MNKLPPELEKIRDEHADEWYDDEAGYYKGFEICYKAMSKTHISFEASEALKADCYAEMKRTHVLMPILPEGTFASFKVTHVPLADVQSLLDVLETAKARFLAIESGAVMSRRRAWSAADDITQELETWNARHGNGDGK